MLCDAALHYMTLCYIIVCKLCCNRMLCYVRLRFDMTLHWFMLRIDSRYVIVCYVMLC